MREAKKIRTITEHYRLTNRIHNRVFTPWDETKEAMKNTSVHSWTFFYHKPYQCDWGQAHQEAIDRKLRYTNECME